MSMSKEEQDKLVSGGIGGGLGFLLGYLLRRKGPGVLVYVESVTPVPPDIEVVVISLLEEPLTTEVICQFGNVILRHDVVLEPGQNTVIFTYQGENAGVSELPIYMTAAVFAATNSWGGWPPGG